MVQTIIYFLRSSAREQKMKTTPQNRHGNVARNYFMAKSYRYGSLYKSHNGCHTVMVPCINLTMARVLGSGSTDLS